MSDWVKIKHSGLGELLPEENEQVLTAQWHDVYKWLYKVGYWRNYEPENTKVWHGGNSRPSHWLRFKKIKEKEKK